MQRKGGQILGKNVWLLLTLPRSSADCSYIFLTLFGTRKTEACPEPRVQLPSERTTVPTKHVTHRDTVFQAHNGNLRSWRLRLKPHPDRVAQSKFPFARAYAASMGSESGLKNRKEDTI